MKPWQQKWYQGLHPFWGRTETLNSKGASVLQDLGIKQKDLKVPKDQSQDLAMTKSFPPESFWGAGSLWVSFFGLSQSPCPWGFHQLNALSYCCSLRLRESLRLTCFDRDFLEASKLEKLWQENFKPNFHPVLLLETQWVPLLSGRKILASWSIPTVSRRSIPRTTWKWKKSLPLEVWHGQDHVYPLYQHIIGRKVLSESHSSLPHSYI